MTAKLVVLYPKPTDVHEFETKYHSKHMPLMRSLVGPDIPLPTYRVKGASGSEPPFYRVAEIHFTDTESLYGFVRSDKARLGQQSSIKVSTGGPPIFLLCASD